MQHALPWHHPVINKWTYVIFVRLLLWRETGDPHSSAIIHPFIPPSGWGIRYSESYFIDMQLLQIFQWNYCDLTSDEYTGVILIESHLTASHNYLMWNSIFHSLTEKSPRIYLSVAPSLSPSVPFSPSMDVCLCMQVCLCMNWRYWMLEASPIACWMQLTFFFFF